MPTYTAADLSETIGWPEETTRRFFRALGFPDAGQEVRYTEADLCVMRTVSEAVVDSDLDLAGAVRLARAIGQNIARLSDWQVAAIATRADQVTDESVTGGSSSHLDAARRIGEQVTDAF